MQMFLLLVSLVSGLLAQESVAPKGWSVEPESGMLVLNPLDLRRNEQVRIDLYDSVQPQGDLKALHLDKPSLVMALAVVAIVSLVASRVPAWRAARVEPAAALRNE